MKKQKARGQVRRFLRRSIACLLAIVGMGMAAVTAGLPQPLGWLGGLGGIQTAMAAQAPAGDGPVPFWQRLLLGDSALLAQWAAESAGQAQGEKPEETAPEEAEEEQNLQAVTPDKIQEKTISGSGSGYVNAQGISLFNRTEKTVDLLDLFKHLVYNDRRQPEAGFIQHHKLWPRHHGTPYRQHLLFTAGQCSSHLILPLF